HRVELTVPLVDPRQPLRLDDLPLECEEAAHAVAEQQPHVAEHRLEVRQIAKRLAPAVRPEDDGELATRFADDRPNALTPPAALLAPLRRHAAAARTAASYNGSREKRSSSSDNTSLAAGGSP